MVIAVLSIAFGIYGAVTGKSFQDYLFSIIIGLSLFIVAYMNLNEMKKNKEEDSDIN